MKSSIRIAIFGMTLAMTISGCTGSGRLSLRSAEESSDLLFGNFTQSVYGFDDHNNLHVVMTEGDPDQPTQAVHIKMYWEPLAGRTPIDENATSAVVHYIVFTDSGAGVYSGGGFLFPKTNPGVKFFKGEIRNASLRLLDSTEDFLDRLGLAYANGGFLAERDDLAAHRAVRQIQLRLHERLGYPRLVGDDSPNSPVIVAR